jgi:hypothetical protein
MTASVPERDGPMQSAPDSTACDQVGPRARATSSFVATTLIVERSRFGRVFAQDGTDFLRTTGAAASQPRNAHNIDLFGLNALSIFCTLA